MGVKLGEAYMGGTVVIEHGTIADLLAVVLDQCVGGRPPVWARSQWLLRYLYRRLTQFNPPTRARRNVAHRYDLDGQLHTLFLDADRLPRASGAGRAALRRALRADVGALSRGLGDGVPRAGDDALPDTADQATGRRTDDP